MQVWKDGRIDEVLVRGVGQKELRLKLNAVLLQRCAAPASL
jgi:hypothetical protein